MEGHKQIILGFTGRCYFKFTLGSKALVKDGKGRTPTIPQLMRKLQVDPSLSFSELMPAACDFSPLSFISWFRNSRGGVSWPGMRVSKVVEFLAYVLSKFGA